MGRPYQNIWAFLEGRTRPGKVHNYTDDGEPQAVEIRVLNSSGGEDTRITDVAFTGAGGTPCLTHLSPTWESEDWSRHRIPHGILFVWEDEYPDPHKVLDSAEAKRQAAVIADNPPLVEGTPPETEGNASQGSLIPPEITVTVSERTFHPADINKDGTITPKELKKYKREHPDAEV
jgi:hypothetical protein